MNQTLVFIIPQCFGGEYYRNHPASLSVCPSMSCKHISLTDELILMKLYIVIVYDLMMGIEKDNSSPKYFKGDNNSSLGTPLFGILSDK